MSFFKRLTISLLAVLAFAFGVVFYLHNTQSVAVNFVFVQLPDLPVAVYLIASVLLGLILGFMANAWMLWRSRAQLAAATRKIRELEQVG